MKSEFRWGGGSSIAKTFWRDYRYRNDRLYQSKLARLDRAMYSNKVQKTKG